MILREPTSRLLSYLRDWQRLTASEITETLAGESREMDLDARHCDASTFVETHALNGTCRVMSQTDVLSRVARIALPEMVARMAGARDFACARLALDAVFDYVGVFEDLPSAVRCIARGVGAAPPADVPLANAGRRDAVRDVLSPRALSLLQDAWADDYELHAHATALARRVNASGYDEAAFEQGPLMSRLAQLTPWYTGWGSGFALGDQLVGSGFHGREAPHTPGVHAWTGPGGRSVLYLPVPVDERLDLFLDVAGYSDPRVQASLRVRIDDREVAIVRRPAAGVAERVWCRMATRRPFAKVELLVDRSYSPDELGTGPGDFRKLGLALRGYGYAVVAQDDRGAAPGGALPERLNVPDGATRGHDPDQAWAVAFVRNALARHRTEDEVLALLTYGISDADLQGAVTLTGLQEAFTRVLSRPPGQDWIDFWVGQPHKTLRRVYQDLIAGQEFRWRRQRLS